MTRTTFSNDMVAHVWAQKRQDSGRSNNGNFYFNGATLYSYGTHFCVAHHLPDNGPTLLNTDGYSVSTSGHKSDAARACRHLQTVYVPRLTALVDTLRYYRNAKDMRKAVRIYCEESAIAGDISDESLAALLQYVGIPQSLAKIQRDAAKAVARRKVDKARKARAAALETLRSATALSDAQWYKATADRLASQHYRSAENVIHDETTLIRKAMRTLTKAGTPVRLWNAAQRVLKSLQAMESRLESDKPRAAQRVRVRHLINELRRAMRSTRFNWESAATARDGEKSQYIWAVSDGLTRASRSLAYIANHESGYVPASLRDKARDAVAMLQPAIDATRETYDSTRVAEREQQRRLDELSREESRVRWFDGLRSNWHGAKPNGAAYLRATGVERDSAGNVTAGTLETSQGANVPLVAAIRAFRFVKLVKERGTPWHANGQQLPVGNFRIDRIETTGNFRAGCHAIDWQEIEALATDLGVFALPAASDAIAV